MALKIRLARGGAKKRPFYRIVVAEASSPRDGRFVEKVGTYNPLLPQGHADRVVLNAERINHWLSVGALPTDRVELFLQNAGLVEKKARAEDPQKSAPKKRAQERLKAEQEALAALKKASEAAAVEEAASPLSLEEASGEAEEVPAVKEPEAPAVIEEIPPALPEEAPPSAPEEAPTIEEEALSESAEERPSPAE